ncbi:uncharacterized protein LOC5520849 [Nematostella vectensis]|uniref:uncharacterized protein LOC5520849 n=1 Tax=Nematostella vectensis TaxID=45351 RepID=UPI002076F05E|nr:uncharacterized protein LOC5520849 [Nematostella vectensis]
MTTRDAVICSVSALAASALAVAVYRYFPRRKQNAYDTKKLVNEYLLFHYGKPEEVLMYDFGPKDALDFPRRCADLCIEHTGDEVPSLALDIGCAVGRSAFELARHFKHVVGIDYSNAFVDTCIQLKLLGKLSYEATTEGVLTSQHEAVIDSQIDRSKTSFQQGDACNLPSDLGQFGCVLGANLICRLPNPYKFLDRLPTLVAPGGIVVLTCPFTWLEEYTPKKLWLGGYTDSSGNPVSGADALKAYLQPNFELIETKDMPFFIRETARKNQWSVAQVFIWRRRKNTVEKS